MARELENALTLPDTPVQIKTEALAPAALHGSVMVLIQFDVCEEIRLDRLREITIYQPGFQAHLVNSCPAGKTPWLGN